MWIYAQSGEIDFALVWTIMWVHVVALFMHHTIVALQSCISFLSIPTCQHMGAIMYQKTVWILENSTSSKFTRKPSKRDAIIQKGHTNGPMLYPCTFFNQIRRTWYFVPSAWWVDNEDFVRGTELDGPEVVVTRSQVGNAFSLASAWTALPPGNGYHRHINEWFFWLKKYHIAHTTKSAALHDEKVTEFWYSID